MGRGRAKAKQAKVARQLKYSGGGTDLDRLRAELGVGAESQDGGQEAHAGDANPADDEEDEDALGDEDLADDADIGAGQARGMSGYGAGQTR